jgi:inhibitor of KinA
MTEAAANPLVFYPLGENALTIEFGSIIDEAISNRVTAFNRLLNQMPFPGMYQTVAAYATLTVFFDPVTVISQKDITGTTCFEKVRNYLQGIEIEDAQNQADDGDVITIRVCYGGEYGPDLQYVAEYHQLSPEEVIQLHSAAVYKVYMIGFVPGFAYMGGLDARLETPRKAMPRNAVQPGSVGIAGAQTGIYPLETPGGWQIIGRTPLKMFDAARKQPALLNAGDRVKFEPVDSADFEKYRRP